MGFGLIGIGQQKREQAMSGFGTVADMESRRNQNNEAIKANYESSETSKKGTMVGTGTMIGSYFGPWGAAAGAAIGYIASELF